MEDKELTTLNNSSSRIGKYIKLGTALVSSLGPLGSVIGTIVNESITNAQQARMVEFVNELYSLYNDLKKDVEDIKTEFEKMLSDSCNSLLFELAMKASAESNSNILHHCYAFYIFNTVQNKQLEDVQHERLFRLISSLSEYEVLMLIGYSNPRFIGEESDFDKQYEEILFSKSRTTDASDSDQIFNAFYDQYLISLEQKGLISMPLELKQKRGKLILEKRNPSITPMGKLVVQAIYDVTFFLGN